MNIMNIIHCIAGDVSSSNENSLTSAKAKRLSGKTKGLINDSKPDCDVIYDNTSHPPARPPRPKRGTPHMRDQRNRPHRPRTKCSPKVAKDKTKVNIHSTQNGIQNEAFTQNDEEPTKASTVANGSVEHSNGNAKSVYTISKSATCCSRFFERKQIPLDEHTYILATDGDMEFDAECVLNLLNLCNNDRRLGGACGRTHPVCPKTGPLVWYQKFDYAKGNHIFYGFWGQDSILIK